ncbi:MAG: TIGR01244 family sulfur transferase [Gammaproteobacteria bacterium]|nr:TIGR01244 family sulfur transferase [Gammaproteobacteria bacterium]MDH4253146.1 TIGR01244 family sulfur transferase [Gammaproteobacteria bacterium]MDH5308492.1 TIGR01244 family sulfur transferase [Gammaproteobacteria bacterium]
MDRRRVTDQFSVSSQLDPHDLEILARQGIRTLINNRPDGEHRLQPRTADLARAARELGLAYVDLPVSSGALTGDVIDRFESLYREVEAPVLAFCRSGTRSISLWALAEARTRGADEVIRQAAEAGYDLSGLRPRLAEQARARD